MDKREAVFYQVDNYQTKPSHVIKTDKTIVDYVLFEHFLNIFEKPNPCCPGVHFILTTKNCFCEKKAISIGENHQEIDKCTVCIFSRLIIFILIKIPCLELNISKRHWPNVELKKEIRFEICDFVVTSAWARYSKRIWDKRGNKTKNMRFYSLIWDRFIC